MSKGLKFVMRDPKKDHIVKWPVQWKMPDAEGELIEVGFIGHFKMLPSKEVNALFGGGMFGRFADPKKNGAGLKEVLTNWSGVMDHDEGGETPFSEEQLENLLAYEDTLTACVTAYAHCIAGHQAKN